MYCVVVNFPAMGIKGSEEYIVASITADVLRECKESAVKTRYEGKLDVFLEEACILGIFKL